MVKSAQRSGDRPAVSPTWRKTKQKGMRLPADPSGMVATGARQLAPQIDGLLDRTRLTSIQFWRIFYFTSLYLYPIDLLQN